MKWHGAQAIEHLLVPIESLQLDPRNARRHPKRNLATIRGSLERSGQMTPIVIGKLSGVVLRGNGTVLALREEEPWTHVAAVVADFGSEQREREYALADNRSGELAEWDPEVLAQELRMLLDDPTADTLGWDELDLRHIFGQATERPPADFPEADEDTMETEHECPKCGYRWSGKS